MARKLNVNRAAVAGSVAAISVTALATGLLLSPAQATDNANGTNLTPDANTPMGPMGDHGRGGLGGPGVHGQYGERIYGDRTGKLSDGTTVVERDVKGTVTEVSSTSITVKAADNTSFTFVVNATTSVDREHAQATIADVVVGDIARVSGTVADNVATATRIGAETEATEAAEQAARDAAGTTTPDPTSTTAPIAPDFDGDGPDGDGPDGDSDGDGPNGMMGGRGHHGGGHDMMGDNDGDGPHAGAPQGDATQGVAPQGGMKGGRGHHGGGRGMMNAVRGELISEVSVFKQTDGTFITVEDFAGEVTAASDSSVTISLADGTSATYTITGATITRDRATATAADIAVGDHLRLEGTLSGDALTVKNVDVMSAAQWAAHEAAAPAVTGSASPASFSTTSGLKAKKTAIAQAKASTQKKSGKSSLKLSA